MQMHKLWKSKQNTCDPGNEKKAHSPNTFSHFPQLLSDTGCWAWFWSVETEPPVGQTGLDFIKCSRILNLFSSLYLPNSGIIGLPYHTQQNLLHFYLFILGDMCTCHYMHVEVKGQLFRVSSLPALWEPWNWTRAVRLGTVPDFLLSPVVKDLLKIHCV